MEKKSCGNLKSISIHKNVPLITNLHIIHIQYLIKSMIFLKIRVDNKILRTMYRIEQDKDSGKLTQRL